MTKRLLALASGRGTDFQAIVDHVQLGVLENVRIDALICNHEGAKVIERAKSNNIKVFEIEGVAGKKFATSEERERDRSRFDRECLSIVDTLGIDLVVLAGFDQIVGREFVDKCKFRILNIHPAYDLRHFGGKNMVGLKVHELVIKSGSSFTGCTVHFVTSDLDLGPPVLKKKVGVARAETAEALERKVLALEHVAYPEAIQLIADERVIVNESGAKCFVDRLSGNWDLEWSVRQKRYLEANQEEAKLISELETIV